MRNDEKLDFKLNISRCLILAQFFNFSCCPFGQLVHLLSELSATLQTRQASLALFYSNGNIIIFREFVITSTYSF